MSRGTPPFPRICQRFQQPAASLPRHGPRKRSFVLRPYLLRTRKSSAGVILYPSYHRSDVIHTVNPLPSKSFRGHPLSDAIKKDFYCSPEASVKVLRSHKQMRILSIVLTSSAYRLRCATPSYVVTTIPLSSPLVNTISLIFYQYYLSHVRLRKSAPETVQSIVTRLPPGISMIFLSTSIHTLQALGLKTLSASIVNCRFFAASI